MASFLGTGWQLLFAAAAIAGLGLAHGASDLEVVERDERGRFLAAYIAAIAAVLLCWSLFPGAALTAFLLLSAVHFAIDDAILSWTGRAVRGALLVGGPAVLHHGAIIALFNPLVGQSLADNLAIGLAAAGGAALLVTVADAARRFDRDGLWLAASAVLVVAPPPLIGFTLGFILIHARPATRERMRDLGYGSVAAYLRSVAPILAGAFAVVVAAVTVANSAAPATAALFAGLAALAIPHMAVTPLFRRPSGRRSPSAAGVRAPPRGSSFRLR